MEAASTQAYSTKSVPAAESFNMRICYVNYLLFGTCLGGFFVISGLMGNIVTIIILGRERKKSSTINCLFMLAIADAFVLLNYGVILVPNGIYAVVLETFSVGRMNLYRFTWTYLTSAARIFNQVSIFITMLVTFQRYVSVCLPLRAKQLCSVKLVNILVFISYLVSVVYFSPNFALYYLVKHSSGLFQPKVHHFVQNPLYQLLYSIIGFCLMTYVIPVTTLGFMSIQILRGLRRQANTLQQSQGETSVRKDLTRSAIAIVGICVICQSFSTANRILMWVFGNGYGRAVTCGGHLHLFMLVPHVMMVFNSAFNFIIYITLAKGFKKKVQRLFSRSRVAPACTSANVPSRPETAVVPIEDS